MSKKEPKIIPLSDRVLLEEDDSNSETTTASGIIIPGSADTDKETKKGKVVAIGDGRIIDGKLEKPKVKVGDMVLYSWGDKIKIDGNTYTIVGSENITAIIR